MLTLNYKNGNWMTDMEIKRKETEVENSFPSVPQQKDPSDGIGIPGYSQPLGNCQFSAQRYYPFCFPYLHIIFIINKGKKYRTFGYTDIGEAQK